MSMSSVVYCVDVGSIPSSNFGWVRRDLSGQFVPGSDFDELVSRLRSDVRDELPLAVGFEFPLFWPLRSRAESLALKRGEWEQSAFSAGAAAAVLPTGLLQMLRLARAVDLRPTSSLRQHQASGIPLIWEAYVQGSGSESCPLDQP
jgi:hypothetical protein